jgi:hypothetical protein
MNNKEAQARIKINKLLEQAGWCFEDSEKGKANISLEPGMIICLIFLSKNIRTFFNLQFLLSYSSKPVHYSHIQE